MTERNIIQIATATLEDKDEIALFALCDDNTTWINWIAGEDGQQSDWSLLKPIPQKQERFSP